MASPAVHHDRFQRLDVDALEHTAASLQDRIVARFPDRQLGRVAGEVHGAVRRAAGAGHRPPLRQAVRYGGIILAGMVSAAAVVAVVIVVRDALDTAAGRTSVDWLPVVESAVNDAAFAALAVFFLLTASQRLDRRVLLAELHRLRSLAHVIDMHQLTKDPERLLSQPPPTGASPAITPMTAVELGRYLDYCSELLSLVAKTAALYAQVSTDPAVLDTVSEIEGLTAGLSGKVWQKISLLHVR
jgi:hypothetical protein